MFELHPQLKRDTLRICSLGLCEALLMDNQLFPWIILVPREDSARELTDLVSDARSMLMEEIALASRALQQLCMPDKINVGALGNKVEQLHVHVIARFTGDMVWPEPVWGGPARAYDDPEPVLAALKQVLMR